jgi:hypothetical protein
VNTAAFAKEYACVEDAVRDSALVHFAIGYYPQAEFTVVGVSIMEQLAEGDNLIVSATLCPVTIDTDSIQPTVIAGMLTSARIIYRMSSSNDYEEIEFLTPRDGDDLWRDTKLIFSEDVFTQIYELEDGKRKQHRLAQEDADKETTLYISGDQNARAVGREYLKTGTNPKAFDIYRMSPLDSSAYGYEYPYFEGDVIWRGKRYRLSIEGEKSYSGILTFESFDLQWNPLSYCKIIIEDEELVVLDGSLLPFADSEYEVLTVLDGS